LLACLVITLKDKGSFTPIPILPIISLCCLLLWNWLAIVELTDGVDGGSISGLEGTSPRRGLSVLPPVAGLESLIPPIGLVSLIIIISGALSKPTRG
jgi:hypothetical protein